MSEWQPIETAPLNGATVQLRFADGKIIRASFEGGLMDSEEHECGGWMAFDADFPPSWTDGICWEVNEDLERSEQPTHWRPSPTPVTRSLGGAK